MALGWQMAELYHAPSDANPPATVASDLPGVGSLDTEEKQRLRVAQLVHGLALIASATENEELTSLHEQVREDVEKGRMPGDLRLLHVELLSALTVADFKLGKAYSLGRALREISREGQSTEELEHHLGDKHLTKLIAWCADLKSALPDHAGQAVANSLRRWQSWGRQRPWSSGIGPVDFNRRLDRQGERWRAILTAEKKALDLLTVGTYIDAGEQLLADASNLAVGFLRKFWVPALAAAVLVLGGLAAIFFVGGDAVIGGLASILTGLGISWRTAGQTLAKVGEQLSKPLWQAELDTAITVAVTDPIVPHTSAAPPSADQPVPVKGATDPRTTRKAAREVWKRLDRVSRTRALTGRDPLKRLGYRFSGLWRGGAKAAFMPHDAYLTQVQSALEDRLAAKDLESDASTRDELFSQFGPNDWEWIKTVVQGGLTRIDGKHGFGLTPAEEPMAARARIVLFGDWATGTPRAQALAKQIEAELAEADPDAELHVIHLGDVYYCGEPDEYQRRFLRFWPARGPHKDAVSWNLNGNHDMYSGGRGYFGLITPPAAAAAPEDETAAAPEDETAAAPEDTTAAASEDKTAAASEDKTGPRPDAFKQQNGTSFFRISNEHWQIIGLDSAYIDNDFDPRQQPWLDKWLGLAPDDQSPTRIQHRKTILLSHHQLGSSQAQGSVGPGIRERTDLARRSRLIHAWFWGHEHRAFVYEPYLDVACPVCIGNGGVPELLSHVFTFAGAFQSTVDVVRNLVAFLKPKRWAARAPKVRFQTETPRVDRQGLKWEKLGYVVIDLNGDRGEAVYHSEDGATYQIDSFAT